MNVLMGSSQEAAAAFLKQRIGFKIWTCAANPMKTEWNKMSQQLHHSFSVSCLKKRGCNTKREHMACICKAYVQLLGSVDDCCTLAPLLGRASLGQLQKAPTPKVPGRGGWSERGTLDYLEWLKSIVSWHPQTRVRDLKINPDVKTAAKKSRASWGLYLILVVAFFSNYLDISEKHFKLQCLFHSFRAGPSYSSSASPAKTQACYEP